MQNITKTGLSTISNKIVETVLSNRVKKKSTPPPPPFKVGCLLISKGRSIKQPVQHCKEGMRQKELYFLLWRLLKHQKAPLRKGVSTNFVADFS